MKTALHYNREFDKQFAYYGHDLGAVCRQETTCFKLWAPFAEKVELRLYKGQEKTPAVYTMIQGGKGVHSLEFGENLHGTYYDFLIWNEGKAIETADPYAAGCSCNGARSMVVDQSRTNPEGFLQDKAPEKTTENIIYELHIKDFSFDPDSGIPEAYRGKYKAFTVEKPDAPYATCLPYLKELGITHVHLMPFYDYGWLDEAGSREQFSWGYDPVNYNVPEGSYATDVTDGSVRIRECKEMIQALHKAGLRVVMDVVYNHTYDMDQWQERTAPGYYYRHREDGTPSDGSACGNDMAAGRAMVDNYIADSVMYWAREYHIDGFRFDLMGLMTTELMGRIRKELDEAFGEGEKLLYGEPWKAGESPAEENTHLAVKDNILLLDEGVAVFSDDTRDLIKGDVFHPEIPGFVNGGTAHEEDIRHAAAGWVTKTAGFHPKSCGQIVHYVSAHDNYTLWDKLLFTMKPGALLSKDDYRKPYEEVLSANKLAAFMYFMFQGNLFLQAGEEMGRTKFGDENSYRSHPKINMLDWSQTLAFRELVVYYKGLIALRKTLPGLYDKSREAYARIHGFRILTEGVVAYRIDNTQQGADTPWTELQIVFNASDKAFPYVLENGQWQILVDDKVSDCRKHIEKIITVPAHSGVLAGKTREES